MSHTIPVLATKLCAVRWIRHSVDCLTNGGSIVPVVLTSDGWIKSVTKTVDRPLMCYQTRSFWGDATVLADNAIRTIETSYFVI